jgi:hypothetical protein
MEECYKKSIHLLIETLKEQGKVTPLEQDILDTYYELNKKPFQRDSAIQRIQVNSVNHPDLFIVIATRPTTVLKP